jgi:hypothetical protein
MLSMTNNKRLYAVLLVVVLPVGLAQTENNDPVILPPVTVEADTPTDYGLEAESDAYRAATQSVTGLGRQTLLETPHSVNVITLGLTHKGLAVARGRGVGGPEGRRQAYMGVFMASSGTSCVKSYTRQIIENQCCASATGLLIGAEQRNVC